MNLKALARDQYLRGRDRWRDARRAFEEERWPDTVRYSQEAVELVLKALLRAVAMEVPKRHDVGPMLEEVAARLPPRVRRELPAIVQLSARLAERRAAAMYGDEADGRPAGEIFRDRGEAKAYLDQTGHVVRLVGEALGIRAVRR